MIKLMTAVALSAAAVASAAPALAQNTEPGFNSNNFSPCDDCFEGATSLGFTANFFGTSYSSTFVGSNGYVTFGSGFSSFVPTGLGPGYTGPPIIAAFYDDIDIRFYGGEPDGSGGSITYGTGVFGGRAAFGVNYVEAGEFARNEAADLENTLQILLVDRSDVAMGDFDIYFNYNSIQWASGTSVGYSAGASNPTAFYQLPGSLMGNAFANGQPFALVDGSNIGDPGRYRLEVRNGMVMNPIPEPATWAMMIAGFGLVGGAMRRRTRITVRYA